MPVILPLLPAIRRLLTAVLLAVALVEPGSEGAARPTMTAVRFHEFGGPEVLRHEDAPRPEPGRGELLVRVHAAGVNPVDAKIRSGALRAWSPDLPQITGFDVSGVVEAVGPEVEGFEAGEAVFAYLDLRRAGGYAEYAIVREGEAARKPERLDHVHAAAVPLAALTAWQALFEHGGLEPGQTVLVHGGSGGVGHFAVQLAKAKGAKVIATASERNQEFLKRLGAGRAIDYRAERFEDVVEDVDLVIDPIGGGTLERSFGVVRPGGTIVSLVQQPSEEDAREHGVRALSMLVRPDAEQLAEIARLIDEGSVKPEVSETIPLAEARRAHEQIETGHTRGKIVLKVRN